MGIITYSLFYFWLLAMVPSSLTLTVTTLEQTEKIAMAIATLVNAGTVLLLNGNLGSGKTNFVKALAKGLDIYTSITSPTFTLIDEHLGGRLPLYHIDLYRLSSKDVQNLHLEEYWKGIDFELGVVAIEWAERLTLLPPEYISLSFISLDFAEQREICITGVGQQYYDLVSKWHPL